MPNDLAKISSFDPAKIELIKTTVAVGATNDELALFLYQCERTGLDPLARQIYFVKRGGKAVIQSSIDGLRLVAQRSKQYAGQDEPEWGYTEKKEAFAKVRVYKWHEKQRYLAAVGVAFWNEYCPPSGQDFMWRKMPKTMIAKVAEAIALRKAFPQELSNIYGEEEMDQAKDATEIKSEPIKAEPTPPTPTHDPAPLDPPVEQPKAPPAAPEQPVAPPEKITKNQVTFLKSLLLDKEGIDPEDKEGVTGYLSLAMDRDINAIEELNKLEATRLIDVLIKQEVIEDKD